MKQRHGLLEFAQLSALWPLQLSHCDRASCSKQPLLSISRALSPAITFINSFIGLAQLSECWHGMFTGKISNVSSEESMFAISVTCTMAPKLRERGEKAGSTGLTSTHSFESTIHYQVQGGNSASSYVRQPQTGENQKITPL